LTMKVTIIWCLLYFARYRDLRARHSFPTRRSSDLVAALVAASAGRCRSDRFRTTRDGRMAADEQCAQNGISEPGLRPRAAACYRSEEHTSELQSRGHLVCRLLLEKKKQIVRYYLIA